MTGASDVLLTAALGLLISLGWSARSLRAARRNFGLVFADAPAGMAVIDLAGRITAANAALCAILRAPAGCIVGRSFYDFVAPEDQAEYGAQFAELLESGFLGPVERRVRALDGSDVWTLLSASHLPHERETPLVVHFQDITGRRHIEDELADRNRRLEEAGRLKDELISVVSHDLRTPLTSIIGYLELAVADDTGGEISRERRDFLEVVQRNSQRLFRLVEDLLFVSRAQGGQACLDLAPLDVSQLVREAVDATLPTAVAGGVQISYHGGAGTGVVGDVHRIAEVVENLLTNAVKFTPEGGRVDVRVIAGEDAVLVRVSDTGRGIDEADRPYLFDRFFRATDAEGLPGAGLGLSIVKAIVDAHGGSIGVESREGEGASFEVRLQRAGPPGDSVAAAA